jgi:hypothetical protein
MNDFVTGKGFLRKDGGSVSKDQEPSALEKMQAKIKSTIHEHHMAAGGGAFKTMKFADGGSKGTLLKRGMGVLGKLFGAADEAVPAALPLAERDANLAKFLEPSKDKRKLYHGSSADISQFKTQRTLENENKPFDPTNFFQEKNGRDAIFLTPDSNFANDWVHGKENASVYPVHAQVKNPFDYDNPEHLEAAKQVYSQLYPLRKDPTSNLMTEIFQRAINELPNESRSGNWTTIEDPRFQKVLNKLGHDSFYVKENNVKNLGLYDPKKIKSAVGNRGTYDTSVRDVTKAQGGLTRAFAGGGISTSAGSFSPEDVGMTAAEMNAPAIPAYVKQNASKLMDEGRAQLEKEYSQLKTPQGRADFIKRLGTSLVGSPHDMLHFGLEIGDYLQTKIPGMSKPVSVLLPPDDPDRIPKFSLADLHTTKEGDVYGGSSGFNTELKKMKFLGKNEYPLMELPVSIFGPSVAVKAGRGLKSMASKAK